MAISTIFISDIIIPLLTAGFSLLGGVGGGYIVWKLSSDNERYRKLYGPLRFNLLMMQLIVENKEETLNEIKKWLSVEMQVNLMEKHLTPLTKRWMEHRNNIRNLFEENSGLVKKDDFTLMSEFMDGCIKREIIEEGKNLLAVNENMINKLLEAIRKFQKKLL